MKLKHLISLAIALSLPFGASAQQWTLQDCINYALEQNLSLQQSKLSVESSQEELLQAKAALFPSLSFSTSHSLSYRPYQETSSIITGSEVLSSTGNVSYTGNYQLGANLTIYQGGINRKNIQNSEISAQISELDGQQTENSIIESIAQTFIQILYAQESVKVNENTLETSTAQLERGKALYEVGSLSKAELAQLSSQVSSDKYQLISSQSSLQTYKLQLKQLLEIQGDVEMELVAPEIGDDVVLNLIPNKQDVYEAALALRPEILSSRLSQESAEINLAIAKAGYLPTLSANAGINTNHTSGTYYTFTEQLKRGWSNTIGLSLSVPIYSNRQNKTAVNKAKIQVKSSALDLAQAEKDLYQTVEGLWLDAQNYQAQYISSKDNAAYCQESYNLVTEQFALGKVNTVELLQEKNNFLSAQQQMLQTKYMAVLSRLMLDFYAGEQISL